MAYDKFTKLKSTCIPLPIENIDTDQIIPARFLKAIERNRGKLEKRINLS